MDGASFEKTIKYFGEENILSIGFDNSARKIFSENEFSLKQSYIPELESLIFVDYDRKGNPFHTVKHVENIQAIMIKDSSVKLSDYDRIGIIS